MPKLIALVATAVIINGERTVIQPGGELPELSRHDTRELLAAGAIEDLSASLKAEQQLTFDEAKALAEFEQARKDVQAADASIAPAPDNTKQGSAAADASTSTTATKVPTTARKAGK